MGSGENGEHIWQLSIVIIIGMFMSILDATIVNVALQSLSKDFAGTSINQVQWVITAYMLSLAAVIPMTGWLTRRVGSKPIYVTSLILFTLGSLACGFAWSIGSLIFFRILQGIGGGMIAPVGQMILAKAAGPHRMGRLMSVIGVPIVLAPVFGPVIGGLLIDNISWRWIFFVNIPIGIIAVPLALKLLPKSDHGEAGGFDWIGFGALGAGLPLFTYGLAEMGSGVALTSLKAGGTLGLGIFLMIYFVIHALHSSKPLLDVRLFKNAAFAAAASTTTLLGASLFGAMILLPLYFQTVRGESAIATGLLLIPQGLGGAFAMPLAGKLADKMGGGIIAVFGTLLICVSTIPFIFISSSTSYTWLEVALLVRGLGMGFAIMPVMSAAFAVLKREQITDASPQLNVLQRVGGSIGTAIFAVVLSSAIASNLHALGTNHPVIHATKKYSAHMLSAQKSALASGYAHTYWWVLGASVIALLPALNLTRVERKRRHEGLTHASGAPIEPEVLAA
jgi:EmrB/QacA subfamily drug resistance transporter